MDKIRRTVLLFAILLIGFGFQTTSAVHAASPPTYFTAVQQELARLGINADCRETTGVCKLLDPFSQHLSNRNAFPLPQIAIRLDDTTSTVRITVEHFMEANALTTDQSRKLLELNHKLVVVKISINPESDSVCLSAIVNTDSNFDRKTFRSVLKGFIEVVIKLQNELNSPPSPNTDTPGNTP